MPLETIIQERGAFFWRPALAIVISLTLLPLALMAANPDWWGQWGVIEPGAAPSDYSAVNQGQLKQIVTASAAEMDARLPGGAGDTLHALINSWTTSTTANDYAAVNLGQVKAVGSIVYKRLLDVGYTTPDQCPWLSGTNANANDYSMANAGQIKNLFSFAFNSYSWDDPVIPDWWLMNFFGTLNVDPDACPSLDGISNYAKYRNGLNPWVYNESLVSALSIVQGGDQRAQPSTVLPDSLNVVAKTGDPNAQVTFTVVSGGALFCSSTDAVTGVASLQVSATTPFTDSNGNQFTVAPTYILLPSSPDRSVIQIAAPSGTGTACVYTTAVAADMNLAPPTDLEAVALSSTSFQLSWTPNDSSKSTTIQFSIDSGATWQNLGSVAAGGTMTTVGGVAPGQTLHFRALTGGWDSSAPGPSEMNIQGFHTNAASTGGGSGAGGPPGPSTVGTIPVTYPMPTIGYATIDIGGPNVTTSVSYIALDDNNNAAVCYKFNSNPEVSCTATAEDRTYVVVTSANGQVNDSRTVTLASESSRISEAVFGVPSPIWEMFGPDFTVVETSGTGDCVYGLRSNGSLIANRWVNDDSSLECITDGTFGGSCSFSCYGFHIPMLYSAQTSEINPLPNIISNRIGTIGLGLTGGACWWYDIYQYMGNLNSFDEIVLDGFTNESYFGSYWYSTETGYRSGRFICSNAGTNIFGTGQQPNFEPWTANLTGWAIGTVNPDTSDAYTAVWNAATGSLVNFSDCILCGLNNQNAVVGIDETGEAFLWSDRIGRKPLMALFDQSIQGSFNSIYPWAITNVANKGYNIVFSATYTPPATAGDGDPPKPVHGNFLLKLPAGEVDIMQLPPGNLVQSINANGILATLDGTDKPRGVLLVPVTLSMKSVNAGARWDNRDCGVDPTLRSRPFYFKAKAQAIAGLKIDILQDAIIEAKVIYDDQSCTYCQMPDFLPDFSKINPVIQTGKDAEGNITCKFGDQPNLSLLAAPRQYVSQLQYSGSLRDFVTVQTGTGARQIIQELSWTFSMSAIFEPSTMTTGSTHYPTKYVSDSVQNTPEIGIVFYGDVPTHQPFQPRTSSGNAYMKEASNWVPSGGSTSAAQKYPNPLPQ